MLLGRRRVAPSPEGGVDVQRRNVDSRDFEIEVAAT